jgi:hypothetical protein
MKNLHAYLDYSQNLSFKELPFNELDGVILSLLPLLDCSISFPKKGKRQLFNCVARHVRVHELNSLGLIVNADIAKLIYRASTTKRFHDLTIHHFSCFIDQISETQSTFLVVDILEDVSVVVFSGTDDTIVGWKEDFKLMYEDVIPCLTHSLNYLNKVGNEIEKMYLVGHSKGGMEAFYAFSYVDQSIQDKIIKVYSYDGPGFSKKVCSGIKEELFVKMKHIIPQGGVVGRLFNSPIKPSIIYSSYRGLQQHDPLSWEVNISKLEFSNFDEFNVQSNLIKKKIDNILNSLPKEKSKEFVHYLFEVLSAGGSYTLTDLSKKPHKALRRFLKLSPENRKLIGSLILYLAKDKIISRELILGMFNINQSR